MDDEDAVRARLEEERARTAARVDALTRDFDEIVEAAQLVSLFTVTLPGEEVPRRYQQTLSVDSDGKLVVNLQRLSTPHSRTTLYKK